MSECLLLIRSSASEQAEVLGSASSKRILKLAQEDAEASTLPHPSTLAMFGSNKEMNLEEVNDIRRFHFDETLLKTKVYQKVTSELFRKEVSRTSSGTLIGQDVSWGESSKGAKKTQYVSGLPEIRCSYGSSESSSDLQAQDLRVTLSVEVEGLGARRRTERLLFQDGDEFCFISGCLQMMLKEITQNSGLASVEQIGTLLKPRIIVSDPLHEEENFPFTPGFWEASLSLLKDAKDKAIAVRAKVSTKGKESGVVQAVSQYSSKNNYDTSSDTPPISVRHQLREKLIQSRIRSSYKGSFIPSGALSEILSIVQIESLFREDEELRLTMTEDSIIVQRIHKDGYRLLAAILVSGINPFGGLLLKFLEQESLDSSMPFNQGSIPPFCYAHRADYHLLCNNQWMVIPPVLEHNTPIRKRRFKSDHILPFIEQDQIGQGGFGDVFKVKVAPGHQKLLPGNVSACRSLLK
jgi:hypothetical protein